MEYLWNFYGLIRKLFGCCIRNEKLYCILQIVGIFFGCIFIPIYLISVPISIHSMVKELYHVEFLPEIKEKYNNKFIYFSIFF